MVFVDSAGRRVEARGRVGDNVLQLARECGVPIEGTGGGGVPMGGVAGGSGGEGFL